MKSFVFSALCAALIGGSGLVFAQGMPVLTYATVSTTCSPAAVTVGGSYKIAVKIDVSPAFHINSVKPNDPDLIPTVVSPGAVSGLSFASPIYPLAKTINAPSLSQKPLSVYTGHVLVKIPVTVRRTAKPGIYTVPISVSFQGCNATSCYPPRQETVNAVVKVL